jgi:hypothetical protein
MEDHVSKKKKRATKKIYLIRVIRELWDRMEVGATLRINKIRAHCLEHLDEDFSFEKVRDALWSFYAEVNQKNSGVNFFAAEPDMMGNKFVGLKKIGNDAEGRTIRANHHRRTFEKDRKRIDTHREYAEVDVQKHLLSTKAVTKILEAAGLSPLIKELPAHS